MNVYDIAHQLARALCATPEYKEFKKMLKISKRIVLQKKC